MPTLERALNSIGKKCFVDYYFSFKEHTDRQALAERLLSENADATSFCAQLTRINYAVWIFDNALEKEALQKILSSKRLDSHTRKKAKEIADSCF